MDLSFCATISSTKPCPIPGNNIEATGLVHLGQFSLPLLNLHQKLTHQPQPTNSPFLIVTQGVQGELWAIPVDEPPNLVKLPKDCIRSLPRSFERNGLSEIVSQVGVLSQEQTLTVFLLDVERLKSSN